jgi:polysaccharide biosynthesis protein PslG
MGIRGGVFGYCICLALLVGVLPGAAEARPLYFGINANTRAWSSPGEEQSRVAETGVRRLREDLEWEKVEPSEGKWEWTKTDAVYQAAAERNMSILPVLDNPPCWGVPKETDPGDCWQTYPVSTATYADFVAHAAARYGPGGDFWKEHPGLNEGLAPRYFEIWNEPYFPSFTNGDVDPAKYGALYKAAVIAGRKANSSTRYLVESAVDVPNPKGEGWVNWAAYMAEAEPEIGKYIDGVAVHPYADNHDPDYEPENGTDSSFKNTDVIYEDWRKQGINKPIWITEVGYSACDDGADRCVPGETQAEREEQKAEWLTDLFNELGEDRYAFVHAVYLYNFREWEEEPNEDFGEWYGIYHSGEHLPAWQSFATAVKEYDGVPTPNTTITGHTIKKNVSATFTFTVNDQTSSLDCQLDEGSWTPCTSPTGYIHLS